MLAIRIAILVISILLIVVILLQKSNSDGMSSAVAGGAEQLFGKKRANAYDKMLHKMTIFLSVVLFIVCLVGVLLS